MFNDIPGSLKHAKMRRATRSLAATFNLQVPVTVQPLATEESFTFHSFFSPLRKSLCKPLSQNQFPTSSFSFFYFYYQLYELSYTEKINFSCPFPLANSVSFPFEAAFMPNEKQPPFDG